MFATQRSTWKDGTDYPMDSRLGDVSHLRPMAKHEKKPSFVAHLNAPIYVLLRLSLQLYSSFS